MKKKQKVIIIGAGPAGLAAGYELLNQSDDFDVLILEELSSVGGISRTVYCDGNNMDIGGHRFHTRIPLVAKWWEQILPIQGRIAYDDKKLRREVPVKKGGPDPEKVDEVLLNRTRISRIFFRGRFFDYPVTLSGATIKNMGLGTTMAVGCSFIKSKIHKRKVKSLEDYYINQFGKKLYSMFFENYTENLWGRHPRDISPEYGSERVNDEISILKMLKNIINPNAKKKMKELKKKDVFVYPKLGPGQMWETVAERIKEKDGRIYLNARVVKIKKNKKNRIVEVEYMRDGKTYREKCDYVISSMPIKDLVAGMNDVPTSISKIAKGLPYRDYIMVGVVLSRLDLKNDTEIPTINNIIPDEWVYIHDKGVKVGRMQIFNNWSPYLPKDVDKTVWLGLEYFCNEGDEMWLMNDGDIKKMAVVEMKKIGLIEDEKCVLSSYVVRQRKAYPAYFDTYAQMDRLKKYLNTIPNLFCVGRNGRHCYSDLDYSICSSFEAANNIISGITEKNNVWNANEKKEYRECK